MKEKKEKQKAAFYSNICLDDNCPECGSISYQRENYEDDGNNVWFPCRCDKCGAKFDNVFKFSHNISDRVIKGKLEER